MFKYFKENGKTEALKEKIEPLFVHKTLWHTGSYNEVSSRDVWTFVYTF